MKQSASQYTIQWQRIKRPNSIQSAQLSRSGGLGTVIVIASLQAILTNGAHPSISAIILSSSSYDPLPPLPSSPLIHQDVRTTTELALKNSLLSRKGGNYHVSEHYHNIVIPNYKYTCTHTHTCALFPSLLYMGSATSILNSQSL